MLAVTTTAAVSQLFRLSGDIKHITILLVSIMVFSDNIRKIDIEI